MEMTADQRRELEKKARCGEPAYVRSKALALVNVADGRSVREVARIFRVSRQSVYAWEKRCRSEGTEGLQVHPGRGRKTRANLQELERYVRQSPRRYGLRRTRWSLAALA